MLASVCRRFPAPASRFLAALLLLPAASIAAPPAESGDGSLQREILAMDARLSEAYAECRTQRLRALFADDAELFFAGRGTLHGVSAHLDALRREGCRQQRDVAADAQRVYPLPGAAGTIDGAIQVGTQRFCAPGAQPCRGAETGFVAVWRRTGSGWKIAQLIRYGYTATP